MFIRTKWKLPYLIYFLLYLVIICIMFRAREELVKSIRGPLITYAYNACCDGY